MEEPNATEDPDGRSQTARQAEDPPAMPYVHSGLPFPAMPRPLVDGVSPMIGWQFRPQAKGGPAFMIFQRSALGGLKVVESFPLTEAGWVSAWHSFITCNPAAIPKVVAALEARAADRARLGPQVYNDIKQSYGPSLATLRSVTFLGGYLPGATLLKSSRYDLAFLKDRLLIAPWREYRVLVDIPYSEIEDVQIDGPGIVKTGRSFVGGGFGGAAAVEGMAIAAALNSLTSRSSIKTVVRIQAKQCELFLLDTSAVPERVRIFLSQPLAAIRAARLADGAGSFQNRPPTGAVSPVDELSKLADMLEKGLLTREEFDLMKARLLGQQT